jgi:hypothetical protein
MLPQKVLDHPLDGKHPIRGLNGGARSFAEAVYAGASPAHLRDERDRAKTDLSYRFRDDRYAEQLINEIQTVVQNHRTEGSSSP